MQGEEKRKLTIAAYGGFRTIPPRPGGAGSDKFAYELYPRMVKRGHSLTAYTRIYPGDISPHKEAYEGINLISFSTVRRAGFDTLLHSCKATFDVMFRNKAKYIHLHSGANSIWAIPLRLVGKKVVVTQFAMDWKRDKWPWYGKLYYLFSNFITAHVPNKVVFDNIFTKEYFEKKYKKKFTFIPYGSEVPEPPDNVNILDKLGVKKGEYFLFVGRFIPDKGIHLLIEAFQKLETDKKLVLVGGAPNPGSYEKKIKDISDKRIVFSGYVYGDDTNILMKNAYTYVQPSLIEGLSPVILSVMGLGVPLICSDIKENTFITGENATAFAVGSSDSLLKAMELSLRNAKAISTKAECGRLDISSRFNWDRIADEYIRVFETA